MDSNKETRAAPRTVSSHLNIYRDVRPPAGRNRTLQSVDSGCTESRNPGPGARTPAAAEITGTSQNGGVYPRDGVPTNRATPSERGPASFAFYPYHHRSPPRASSPTTAAGYTPARYLRRTYVAPTSHLRKREAVIEARQHLDRILGPIEIGHHQINTTLRGGHLRRDARHERVRTPSAQHARPNRRLHGGTTPFHSTPLHH